MKITLHNNLIHLANFCPNTLMSIQNRHQESDFVLLKYIIYSNVILLNFKDYTLRTIEFNLIYEVRMIGIPLSKCHRYFSRVRPTSCIRYLGFPKIS